MYTWLQHLKVVGQALNVAQVFLQLVQFGADLFRYLKKKILILSV